MAKFLNITWNNAKLGEKWYNKNENMKKTKSIFAKILLKVYLII